MSKAGQVSNEKLKTAEEELTEYVAKEYNFNVETMGSPVYFALLKLVDLKAKCIECKAKYEGKLDNAREVGKAALELEKNLNEKHLGKLAIKNSSQIAALDQLKQERDELKAFKSEHFNADCNCDECQKEAKEIGEPYE